MKNKPKVSVIMPSLNVAPYIRQCMDSVAGQTLKEIEIICVDAGSTDGTLEILREYMEKDERIRFVRSDKKSYGRQINLGVQAAKGEYIGIVETDDYILPAMYEKLYAKAKQYDVDVIKADYYRFQGEGETEQREYLSIVIPDISEKLLDPRQEPRCVAFVPNPAGIFKRTFLISNGIEHNETPGAAYQDNGFFFLTHCCARRIYFLHEPFYCYRRDNPNSSIHRPDKVFMVCGEYEYIYDFLKKRPELHDIFMKRYCREMFNTYWGNYVRVAEEYKLQFLMRFAADFERLKDRGEFYTDDLDKVRKQRLQEIMRSPEEFYFNDRSSHYLKKLQPAPASTGGNAILQMQVKSLQEEISNIHASWTYRIGRAVTFFPRKLRGGIRCYQEHGMRYTLHRVKEKYQALRRRGQKTAEQKKPQKAEEIKPGCAAKKHTPELIVSLTSFPARIKTVHKTVDTILRQTERPDRVVLWLAEEQFPGKEKELPAELTALCRYGLEIRWCRDIKSYKKLIPALKAFPEAVIVTADDDVYYDPRWLEYLYTSYQKWPYHIHCHRDTCFYFENGEWKWVPAGKKVYPCPSYLHKQVGIGGVLYPPHSLHPDVLREELFTKLAETNDDIWFWFMAIRNHYKVLVVDHCMPQPRYVEGTQEGECLGKVNDIGPKLFLRDFDALMSFYPEVRAALEEEVGFVADYEKCLTVKNKKYDYYASLQPSEYRANLVEWFHRVMGEWLNFDAPRTFCQKIQWLKLYDSTPIKTRLADKYLVRDWVKEKIGEEHLIPLLGVWDSFDEIDFDALPDQFALKANHGSGMNVVVKNKSRLDVEDARKKFDKWLKTNYAFTWGLEIQYLNMPPRIIAEKYMEEMGEGLYDYKIHCFGGKPVFIQCIGDRNLEKHTGHQNNYDISWNKLDWIFEDYPQFPYEVPKPKLLDEMVACAAKLSEDFSYVRVDLYEVNGHVYFGEMTFTPAGGCYPYKGLWNKELDMQLGSWIHLPPKSPIPERML